MKPKKSSQQSCSRLFTDWERYGNTSTRNSTVCSHCSQGSHPNAMTLPTTAGLTPSSIIVINKR